MAFNTTKSRPTLFNFAIAVAAAGSLCAIAFAQTPPAHDRMNKSDRVARSYRGETENNSTQLESSTVDFGDVSTNGGASQDSKTYTLNDRPLSFWVATLLAGLVVALLVLQRRGYTARNSDPASLATEGTKARDTLHREVAISSGVLHNVGNVLNSVNITTLLLHEKLRNSRISKLSDVAAMLRDHEGDLASFVTTDPRGKALAPFLISLCECLAADREQMSADFNDLRANLEHIKSVIRAQQNYAKRSNTIEEVDLAELLEKALRLSATTAGQHSIEVVREYEVVSRVCSQPDIILQILVNLLSNATQSLGSSQQDEKRLTLRIHETDHANVQVEVVDNGQGVSAANMPRLFQHGFTTKKSGHGIGLHSAVLAAESLGASLRAQSDGAGQGATFVLSLPLSPSGTERRKEHRHYTDAPADLFALQNSGSTLDQYSPT